MLARMHTLEQEVSMLAAGSALYPFMAERADRRYGRIIAASLASLARRGHVELVGWQLTRTDSRGDPLAAEEMRMLGILFADGERTVSPGGRLFADEWTRLAAQLHRGLRERGLRLRDRDRWHLVRDLLKLKASMRRHVAVEQRRWQDDPELYRTGLAHAVLFGLEGRPWFWPQPPLRDRAWIPPALAAACVSMVAPPISAPPTSGA